MLWLRVAKFAANAIASVGVAAVLDGVFKKNIIPRNTAHKWAISVGTFVLGGAVVEYTSRYFNRQWEGLVHAWKHRKDKEEETPDKKK